MDKISEALSHIADFTEQEKQLIRKHSTAVTLPARWPAIKQGAPDDHVYIVIDGTVRVLKGKKAVAHLGPGSIVGELAEARRALRNATVVAAFGVSLLHIGSHDWEMLQERIPALKRTVEEIVRIRSLEA